MSGCVEWDSYRKTRVIDRQIWNLVQKMRAQRPHLLSLLPTAGTQHPRFPIRIPLHTAPPNSTTSGAWHCPVMAPTRHQAPSDCPLRLAWLSWHPSTALHHAPRRATGRAPVDFSQAKSSRKCGIFCLPDNSRTELTDAGMSCTSRRSPTAGHVPPDRPRGCTARHVGRPRGARPLHTGPMGPLGPCRAHRLALVASRWVMRTEIGRGGASGPGGPGWGSLLWWCRMTQRTRRGGSWWHLAPQGSPLDHWGGYCAFRGPAIAHTGAQTARVTSVFHRGATRVFSLRR